MAEERDKKSRPRKQKGKHAPPFSVWWLVAILAATALVYWQADVIGSYAADALDYILGIFGLGSIILLAFLLVLLWLLVRRGLRGMLWTVIKSWQYWHYWLGGIALTLAVFGILAFFTPTVGILADTTMAEATLGGGLGLGVIGSAGFLGGLRVVALVLAGSFLIAPRVTCKVLRALGMTGFWFGKRLALAGFALYRLITGIGHRRPSPVAEVTPEGEGQQPLAQSGDVAAANPPLTAEEASKIEMSPAAKEDEAKKAKPSLLSPRAELKKAVQALGKRYAASAPVIASGGWKLPSLEILELVAEGQVSQVDNERRAKALENALVSYGVDAKVVQINEGPTVTQFGVEPGWDRKFKEIKEKDKNGNVKTHQEEVSKTRVKVERISSLSNDLALAMAAPTIRIEAPVPGKSIVGVEVPNTTAGLVTLRGVMSTPAYQKLKAKSKLAIALGKGAGGETVMGDLASMPHLLIAGATGSGKTVCLNATIACVMMNNTPNDAKFIMIDPKRVEMVAYGGSPHLITPVIFDADKAVGALRWLNAEMDNRYRRFAAAGDRNIQGYNKSHPNGPLPYIVLIIDELADLMMAAYDEVERSLCRLAQLARATGIHLVVATQRPSVDVVTGLIKANFPTRVSFAVASQVDSRTILDCVGAEKLLGKGDMLYLPTDAPKPKRLQGCFVSDPEIDRIVNFWISQRKDVAPSLKAEELAAAPAAAETPADPLLQEAKQLAKEHKTISASFLQRQMHIGKDKAEQLMEQMEKDKEANAPPLPPIVPPDTSSAGKGKEPGAS